MSTPFRPTALPVSLPVRGTGWVGASAQEQATYQPSASGERVTVVGVPAWGRLQRTALRPSLDRTKHPWSRVAPVPNCL